MSRGKHLSLEEARHSGKLEQFAKEHPMETDAERFKRVLAVMSKAETGGQKPKPKAGTSGPGASASSSGIRSRRDTSEDA
jgi:hypothetical protein